MLEKDKKEIYNRVMENIAKQVKGMLNENSIPFGFSDEKEISLRQCLFDDSSLKTLKNMRMFIKVPNDDMQLAVLGVLSLNKKLKIYRLSLLNFFKKYAYKDININSNSSEQFDMIVLYNYYHLSDDQLDFIYKLINEVSKPIIFIGEDPGDIDRSKVRICTLKTQ